MSYSVLNTKKIIDVIKYRWVWLVLSFVLLFPGIIAMLYSMKVYPTHTPLLVGIDFTGGTIIQYSVNFNPSEAKDCRFAAVADCRPKQGLSSV